MLIHAHRTGRRRDQGQALVMALTFIFFFGLVIVAVLRFADVAFLQHAHTEATASTDAGAEGGAAYGSADASRSDLGWTCTDSGTLTMTNAVRVGYTVRSCNPESTTHLTGAGTCLLCILNQTPAPGNANCSAAYSVACPVLTLHPSITTYGGDDDVNGSISSNTTLTALTCSSYPAPPCNGQGYAHIRYLSGATVTGCTCTPAPSAYLRVASDPLTGIPGPASAAQPTVCTTTSGCTPCSTATGFTWSANTGCSNTNITKNCTTFSPGLWGAITINGKAQVAFQPGVYVFTSPLVIAGNPHVAVYAPGTISTTGGACSAVQSSPSVGNGVTVYLTCPGSISAGCPVESSFTGGGSINISGNGSVVLAGPLCPPTSWPTNPAGNQTKPCPGDYTDYGYDGVALIADPHLLDGTTGSAGAGGGDVSTCITTGADCALEVSGNGGSVEGSVDMRGAGIGCTGNCGESISNGFLIANSLYTSVSGGATGIALSGPGTVSSAGACDVLDMGVYRGATAPGNSAAAVIQSQCGSSAESGIVNFNFPP